MYSYVLDRVQVHWSAKFKWFSFTKSWIQHYIYLLVSVNKNCLKVLGKQYTRQIRKIGLYINYTMSCTCVRQGKTIYIGKITKCKTVRYNAATFVSCHRPINVYIHHYNKKPQNAKYLLHQRISTCTYNNITCNVFVHIMQ